MADLMSGAERANILALLKTRTSFYRQMQTISFEQMEVCRQNELDAGVMARLSALIEKRQGLMDEIDRINNEINILREPLRDRSLVDVQANSGERMSWPEASEEEVIVAAIQQNDEVCLNWLHDKSQEVASLIKKTRANRAAFDAYQATEPDNVAWFVDKKK